MKHLLAKKSSFSKSLTLRGFTSEKYDSSAFAKKIAAPKSLENLFSSWIQTFTSYPFKPFHKHSFTLGIRHFSTQLEQKDQPFIPNDKASVLLADAVRNNDEGGVKTLLKKGYKLVHKDLHKAFMLEGKHVQAHILEMLAEGEALPKDVSLTTLQCTLYAGGNPYIRFADWWGKPDLKLEGCKGLLSPIEMATKAGNPAMVNFLIRKGVKSRPMQLLFTRVPASKELLWMTLAGLEKFEESVSEIIKRVEGQCEIAALFLKHPTEELTKLFKTEQSYLAHDSRLWVFFGWAAMHNQADLLDHPPFIKLFTAYEDASREVVKIAAVSGAADFLIKAFDKELLTHADIRAAMSIAVIGRDHAMLENLQQAMLKRGGIQTESEKLTFGIDDPLFWAVQDDNLAAAEILLKRGEYTLHRSIGFLKEESYLHIAVTSGHQAMAELLLEHGAHSDQMTREARKAPIYGMENNAQAPKGAIEPDRFNAERMSESQLPHLPKDYQNRGLKEILEGEQSQDQGGIYKGR